MNYSALHLLTSANEIKQNPLDLFGALVEHVEEGG